MKFGNVNIRPFTENDILNKVRWINDCENNKFLHYELPLDEDKTRAWFHKNKDRADRYDAIIEYDRNPVGVIGLLSIVDGRAEYYITLGESRYRGKGIARDASILLLKYAFDELDLLEVYLYTEVSFPCSNTSSIIFSSNLVPKVTVDKDCVSPRVKIAEP